MSDSAKVLKEPLFQIEKRDKDSIPWWKKWLIRIIAVACALVVCGIITFLVIGENPFRVYAVMFEGTLGSERRIWNLLQNTAILLVVSLAVTPAFKMRFWNIGAEGQVLMGALGAVACVFYLGGKIDNTLLLLLMLASSMLLSCIWAVIPAIFKAKWNTNETLFTLMMNYIAMQLVSFFLAVWVKNGSGVLGVLKYGHLPELLNGWLLNILIVAVVTALMYVYLKFTKHGYEIAVVGESEKTARYVGINVKKVIIRTLLISGLVAGIAGFILVAGVHHTIDPNTVGGQGFTAIMVSWLGNFNPLYMVGTSFFVTFLDQGAAEVSTIYGLSKAFPDIIVGIIFFFIIGSEFFIHFVLKFRKKKQGGKQ